MRSHAYLRAYMAGIAIPTLFLILVVAFFPSFALYFEVPSQFVFGAPARPLERAILLPMALVPNVWGAWNMLYLPLRRRIRLPFAVYGAILPLLLFPLGIALAQLLDVFTVNWRLALPAVPIGMAIYYFAWKYLVAFLNEEMGIA